jgi:hypothetical protein
MPKPTPPTAASFRYVDDPTCREIFADLFQANAYGTSSNPAAPASAQVVRIEFVSIRFEPDPPHGPDRRAPVARISMTPGTAATLASELQKILQTPPAAMPPQRTN